MSLAFYCSLCVCVCGLFIGVCWWVVIECLSCSIVLCVCVCGLFIGVCGWVVIECLSRSIVLCVCAVCRD